MNTKKNRQIVIAGGGTGGHIYPALAIADGLVEKGIDKGNIVFYGSSRTMERDLIPAAGYKLLTFAGRGLNKNDTFKNIGHGAMIFFSCIKAFFLMVLNRPALVVGVGGFASVPALGAATILGIPKVVHEQNSFLGRTNRLALKFGATVLTTFEETFPKNDSYIRVGLPMSSEINKALQVREQFLNSSSKEDTVVISGGSLGSVAINNAVIEMLEKYKDEIDFLIVHICGKQNYEEVKRAYAEIGNLDFLALHSYRDDIKTIYARSNCIVSRSGAGTCVELETLGLRSILIPLPGAPGDHQTYNAKDLVNSGMGTIVKQSDLSGEVLYKEIRNAFNSPSKLKRNSFHLDARLRIADFLVSSALDTKSNESKRYEQ